LRLRHLCNLHHSKPQHGPQSCQPSLIQISSASADVGYSSASGVVPVKIRRRSRMSAREQYIEKAKARIDQWNAEIDKMKAQVHEAEADVKIKYQKQLDKMRAQRDDGDAKLKEVRHASDAAWDDMKSGFDKAWGDIAGAFDDARSRFK
jgi:multidrug resistance efflux pump